MNECTKVKTSKTLLSISRKKNFKQFLHLLDVSGKKNLCFKVISQDNGRVLFQIPIIHYYLQFVGFFLCFEQITLFMFDRILGENSRGRDE